MQHLTSPDPVGMGAVAPQVEHSIPYGDTGQILQTHTRYGCCTLNAVSMSTGGRTDRHPEAAQNLHRQTVTWITANFACYSCNESPKYP